MLILSGFIFIFIVCIALLAFLMKSEKAKPAPASRKKTASRTPKSAAPPLKPPLAAQRHQLTLKLRQLMQSNPELQGKHQALVKWMSMYPGIACNALRPWLHEGMKKEEVKRGK